ncbi:MAG: response regulator transcription factor [Planctomycetes bacterium]|jgi:DNA-binding NarL/FixJ family response regulator|nr:response regulator transcription factor [Planctomycetota bacterium]
MATVRVLIADDDPALPTILARVLQTRRSIEVGGEAADGYSAVLLTGKLRPDILLMDISMPGLNGMEADRRIMRRRPGVKVLGLPVHGFEFYARQMFEAGARAYGLKNGDLDELREAMDAVCRGETYVSPDVLSLGARTARWRRSRQFSHAA